MDWIGTWLSGVAVGIVLATLLRQWRESKMHRRGGGPPLPPGVPRPDPPPRPRRHDA